MYSGAAARCSPLDLVRSAPGVPACPCVWLTCTALMLASYASFFSRSRSRSRSRSLLRLRVLLLLRLQGKGHTGGVSKAGWEGERHRLQAINVSSALLHLTCYGDSPLNVPCLALWTVTVTDAHTA